MRAREIRVLAETAPIPSDVIAVRAHCPPHIAERVRDAFVHMHESPEGRELLTRIFNAERAVATDVADYAAIERMVPREAHGRTPRAPRPQPRATDSKGSP